MERKSTGKRKLKILCIHGYTTSKEFMKFQMKEWEKELSNKLEFIYYEGQYDLPYEGNGIYIPGNEPVIKWHKDRGIGLKTHFNYDDEKRFDKVTEAYEFQDGKYVKETFKRIIDTINENEGEIDGILGFSLGGFYASYFFHCLESGLLDEHLKFKEKIPYFCILVCCHFGHGYFFNHVKSLHFIGRKDQAFLSCEFPMMRFVKPEYMYFGGDHRMPYITLEFREKLFGFLKKVNREDFLKEVERKRKMGIKIRVHKL